MSAESPEGLAAGEIEALYRRYVLTTYAPASLALARGRGAWVWDVAGRRYLDFLSGIAVTGVGHAHPTLVRAIRRQAGRLMHTSNLFYHEPQARLAEALATRSMGGGCFFCNSGAEANEALIKLARLWGSQNGGRWRIVTMRNSFHGRTLATLTATGQAKVQRGFEPLPDGFDYADFNDLDSVRAAISEQTAAVLVEAIQGEGGIVPATERFLSGLRRLCTESGVLLMMDEVQCGMGRTGRWWAWQAYGIEPDAFSIAKGLGGGFPIGAIVVAPGLTQVFQPGTHASTFGGTPLACVAALAVIRIIEEEGLLENAARRGEQFMEGLRELQKRHAALVEVRGRGLMVGLVLDRPAKPFEARLRELGLLSLATAERVIRFLPPLTIREREVERALSIVARACRDL
ncbi:MAG: aspartate aminotransferase family protein [Kiritimatiellae bacterium]|nr:aspartate aminotransferase family protein [Kiritimatiellia bacterium]